MKTHVADLGLIRFAPAVVSCALAFLPGFLSSGCQRPSEVPESGAVLLRVAIPAAGPVPGELRTWVYDSAGVLFGNARFPEQGSLPIPANGKDLGTILIQPGVVTGSLRIHVRGLTAGARVSDAVAVLGADMRNRATVELALSTEVLSDDDLDDVPDVIDDCLERFNPEQGGCPVIGAPDASADGSVSPDGMAADGDAGATDIRVSDASVADMQRGDAPILDAQLVESGGLDGRAVDAGIADARPADIVPVDAVRVDTPPVDAGADGSSKALRAACLSAGECASGFCADGICCQAACDQPCQQCLLGWCLAVLRQQDIPQCAGTLMCNPNGKCVGGD